MTRRTRRGRRAPDPPAAYDAAIDRVIARLPELAARAARRAGRVAPPGPGSTGPRLARGDEMAANPKPSGVPAPPPLVRSRRPPGCEWEDDAVFRHTFLEVLRPEHAAAVRAFGEVQFSMALEYAPRARTPDESMAARLRAVAADLRFLQGYLTTLCNLDEEPDGDGGEEGEAGVAPAPWESPLRVRWRRFGARLGARLGGIAEEIEAELAAGRRGARD